MSHRRKLIPTIIKILPFLILLLAFLLQVRYLIELRDMFPQTFGSQPFCGVDAKAHVQRAAGFLDGSIPGQSTFVFIPLYPFYLAILKKFLGDSLLLPIFLQALLQIIGMSALYGIGRLTFSTLTGILAALGLATYNYYLFYLPCFDQSLLTTPFLILAVFLLLKYDLHQKSRYLLAAGVALAAATLSRPTILIVFLAIIIWLYFDFRRHRRGIINGQSSLDQSGMSLRAVAVAYWPFIRNVILLMLPVLVVVSPFTWHNYRVGGRFILLSDNFGVNIFTGNNPDASGLDSLAHVQSQPAAVRFIETNTRVLRGETTLTAEVLRYIIEQPGDWLALTASKTWLWFGEVDELLVSPFFPLTVSQSRVLTPLPLEWQATTIVALLGILLAHVPRGSRQRIYLLWLVYGTLSVVTIVFFVQLRFRLPFASFVILSAAALVASAPYLYWRYPRRFWAVLILMMILYPIVPMLWIFILLFVGLGMWSKHSAYRLSSQSTNVSRSGNSSIVRGRLMVAICVYLVAVGLWIRAEALASEVSQTIDHYLGPPLAASGILGQTFQMDCDGLNRIEVTLGTFNDQHNQPVTFYLATNPSAQEILFSETFDGSSVRDYQKKRFSFSPIPNSAGRTYFFYIASPTSTPQNGITARGYTDTPVDHYPAGNAWAGELKTLQKFQADFAFTAYCDLTLWQKVKAVFEEFF